MTAEGNDLRVDIEALAGSAAQVVGQVDHLASAHLATDDRIASAHSGWVGRSAASLQSRTAAWVETSRRLLTGVGDYALTLHNDGIILAAFDRDSTEKLRVAKPGACGRA